MTDSEKEMDTQAWSIARGAIAQKHETPLEHFLKKRTHYNELQAAKELTEDNLNEVQKRHDFELAILVAAKEEKEKYTAESWKLFFANLTPVSIGNEQEILSWSHRFIDEVTGEKSPSIANIIRERCPAIPEKIALSDPKKFAQEISSAFNAKVFEYEFNRTDIDPIRWRHSNSRWFAVKFMLRQKNVPPKI